MNTDHPLFSILIPVYNSSKYLGECLDSVINQTVTDWEAICVNDASTDNSLEILQKYAAKDSRIKIINHEYNKNLYAARSTGIQAAQGKYAAFLDSDDFLHPKFLETGKKLLEAGDYSFVQMGFHIYGNRTGPKHPVLSEIVIPEKFLYGGLISRKYGFALWGNVYHTEILKKTDVNYDQPILNGEDSLRLINLLTHSDKKIRVESAHKMIYYRLGVGTNGRKSYSFQHFKNSLTYYYAYQQEIKILPSSILPAFLKKYGPPETAFSLELFQILVKKMATREDFLKGIQLFCNEYSFELFSQYLADCHIVYLKCNFVQYIKQIFFFSSLAIKHISKKLLGKFL